jgi:hypothetical protein
MPRLDFFPYDGRIPKHDKLRRRVESLLTIGGTPAEAVIALTDVYTGTNDFINATDAKAKMRQWVGPDDRFHPHVAQYDFEAWLVPYWREIQEIAGHNKNPPPGHPEGVNHNHPPSYHVREIFRIAPLFDNLTSHCSSTVYRGLSSLDRRFTRYQGGGSGDQTIRSCVQARPLGRPSPPRSPRYTVD